MIDNNNYTCSECSVDQFLCRLLLSVVAVVVTDMKEFCRFGAIQCLTESSENMGNNEVMQY